MKKKIGICAIILGLLLTLQEVIEQVAFHLCMNKSIKEIGGADGPTSVFLAGKVGTLSNVSIAAGAVLLLIGIILLILNKKSKK